MAVYVALTTTNPQDGWYAVAVGKRKEDVQARAEEAIGDCATDYGTDINKDTEHRNLVVVPKTTAMRTYGVDISKLVYPIPD